MHDLQYFNDWLALTEAKARYCRFLDTKDWEGFGGIMTEDFAMDTGQGTSAPIVGRDVVVKSVQSSILTAKTAHQAHSPEIQIEGDEARVIWAIQDRLIWGPERPSMTGYAHHHERWVKRNGQWKIAALRVARLLMDFSPPAGSPPAK